MTGEGDQEHAVSITTAGRGLLLPVHRDPQELKKKRNRLAQRKHRLKTPSMSNRQHEAPEDKSARCKKPPLLKKPLNQYHSEASVSQIPYTTYQNSQMVSALGFPLPGSPQIPTHSSQLKDLEQHTIPVSEASFDNLGTAFLPENLGIRQDLVTQSFRGFLSQNDPSHIYEAHQQQPPQYQPQVDRPSRIRAEGGISQTLMQTHDSYSPAQPTHTRVGVEVSRPNLQTLNVSPPAISNAEITRKTTDSFIAPDSEPTLPEQNLDRINNDSSSPTRSEADIDSDYAESEFQGTPSSMDEAENIEARFESIIRAVEGAGFESIDDMSTQYYTTTFQEDTVSHWAQSRSRSRSLHAFLASLHASTHTWSDREVQGYRQQITEAAESLYVGELSNAMEDIMQNGRRRSQALGEKVPSPIPPTASSVQSLWQIVAEIEPSHDFKQKRMLLREKMPETWSLLLELTRKAGLRQPRGSQAASAFLLLLLEPSLDKTPIAPRAVDGKLFQCGH